ncbi:MAG: PorV/PorQ family protein [Odoribacteraceae bacterium]|jgi:hypothetical protein|nr:PorV/PorQ family protein [Odoribacteraceae bacterium]
MKLRIIVALLALLPATARPQSGAALFLGLPADARPAGMGGGGVALHGGAFSIFHNPAALPFTTARWSVGVGRAPYLRALLPGGSLNAAGATLRVSKRGNMAAGFRYRSHPTAEARDNNTGIVGEIRPAEWAAEVAYAHLLPAGLGLSVTARYTRLYNGYRAKEALGIDAGMYYRETFSGDGGTWAVAFHAGNLGSKIDRAYLPARAALGGSVILPVARGALLGSLDLAYTFLPARAAHLETAAGMEYSLRWWSLRAGYRAGGGSKGMDNHASIGGSLRASTVACHVAYWITSPSSALRDTWHLSVEFSW